MEVITVEIDKIKPYENNPRVHDKTIPALMESIKKFGYINPIIVDENFVILAGEGRWKALKMLKGTLDKEIEKETDENRRKILEKINKGLVDVIVVKGLSEEKKKEYRIVDNRLAELSEWDYVRLMSEIDTLMSSGLGIPIGFTFDDISKIKKEFLEIKEEYEKEELKEENLMPKESEEDILKEIERKKQIYVICPYCLTKIEEIECPNCHKKFKIG